MSGGPAENRTHSSKPKPPTSIPNGRVGRIEMDGDFTDKEKKIIAATENREKFRGKKERN